MKPDVRAALPLTALAIALGAGARGAAASPEPEQSRPRLVVEVSGVLGYGSARAESRYDNTEPGDESDTNQASARSPAGALDLAIGARLGSAGLAVTGFARLGRITVANRFTDERSGAWYVLLGPRFTLAPAALAGGYVSVSGGLAHLEHMGRGATATAGYRLRLEPDWDLAVGIELAGVWSQSSEYGDHGTYQYDDRLYTASLIATVARH